MFYSSLYVAKMYILNCGGELAAVYYVYCAYMPSAVRPDIYGLKKAYVKLRLYINRNSSSRYFFFQPNVNFQVEENRVRLYALTPVSWVLCAAKQPR